MELRVSTEVEPALFDEAQLEGVGAHVVRHVQPAWISVAVDSAHVAELARIRGVLDILPVLACEDRLDQLPAGTTWEPLAKGGEAGLLELVLEAARHGDAVVALRLTATALDVCFLRAHRTDGVDIELGQPDPGAPGGWRHVAAHSDGLRDRSNAGMHNWTRGERRQIAMWVGLLPRGAYHVRAGIVDGWLRVAGRPRPCVLECDLTDVGGEP